MSGINILTNPGFEQPLVNDPVKGWSCQGETDDPRGGVIARYTRHQAKEVQHSGICLARLSEWAGPGQYIGKVPVRELLILTKKVKFGPRSSYINVFNIMREGKSVSIFLTWNDRALGYRLKGKDKID